MTPSKYQKMLAGHPKVSMSVPPSPGVDMPWTRSNNLGNIVDFAADSNNRQLVLKLDEWGPPDVWTVSLGITFDPWSVDAPLNKYNTCDVTASIDFGVGGSTQTVKMSWLNGTTIAMPMNAVSVTAEYWIPKTLVDFVPPPNLRLSAQLARGYRESNARLISYLAQAHEVASNQYMFLVPRFANQVMLIGDENWTPSNVFSATNQLIVSGRTRLSDSGIFVEPVWKTSNVFNVWVDLLPATRSIIYNDVDTSEPNFAMHWKIGNSI